MERRYFSSSSIRHGWISKIKIGTAENSNSRRRACLVSRLWCGVVFVEGEGHTPWRYRGNPAEVAGAQIGSPGALDRRKSTLARPDNAAVPIAR